MSRVATSTDSELPAAGSAWSFAAVIALAELVLCVAAAVAPHVSLPPLLAFGVGFAAVVSSAIASAWACPRVEKRELALLFVPALGVASAIAVPLPELANAALITAVWLWAGSWLGAAIGGAIERTRHLLFVAIVSGLADCVSLLHPHGPSATIAQSREALSLLALPWPMLGTPHIEAFLGAGDVVFTALYVASSRRHALSLARTVLGLTLAYGVTMVLVVLLERPVPVLPLLGLGVVLAQPETRRISS